MDISTDEVRRQLRESQTEHVASLRPWREVLARAFDRDRKVAEAAKREVLGLPGRRQFLQIGGASIAMSAVLAACGSDAAETNVPESGERPTTTTTAEGEEQTDSEAARELDLTLLRTAQSLEVLAIAAYQAAIDSGQVETDAVVEAALLFQAQHEDHAALLSRTTLDLDGTPYDEPNPVILESLSDTLDGIGEADEATILGVAADLENVAAQTYSFAGGVLSTPELRGAAMSIGTTEARHLALLKAVLELQPVEFPFLPLRDRVPEEALIPADSDPDTGSASEGD